MSSPYNRAGLLYVGSRIQDSANLSTATYDNWYDDVHVPHILETSGVQSAARYIINSTEDNEFNWPFLAIYPIKDLHYLTTEEFAAVPMTDDLLPGPSHSCLDCADFDQRHYVLIGKFHTGQMPLDPAPKLVVIHFNPPAELRDADKGKIQEWYIGLHQHVDKVVQRVRVYNLIVARRFADSDSAKLPSFIALHEVSTDSDSQKVLAAVHSISTIAMTYNAWKNFGLATTEF